MVGTKKEEKAKINNNYPVDRYMVYLIDRIVVVYFSYTLHLIA